MVDLDDVRIAELKEMFELFDKDGSGGISENELYGVMKNMGYEITESECKDMIMRADQDSNGCIDFEEFKIMMSRQPKIEEEA